MAYTKLTYSKTWNGKDASGNWYFPTYEGEEAQVRADLQLLFDEAKAALNNLIDAIGASNVPFTATAGIPKTNVQEAIEALYTQLVNTVLGVIPDASLTAAKLADLTVTGAKIAAGTITADKMASGVLTSKADLVNGKVSASQSSAAVVSASDSKTLALTDAGTVQRMTNTAAATVTIPLNSAVAFPVGTEIEIYRAGAGTVTVVPTSGVTLECAATAYAIKDQYSRAHLKKWAENTWSVEGNVG